MTKVLFIRRHLNTILKFFFEEISLNSCVAFVELMYILLMIERFVRRVAIFTMLISKGSGNCLIPAGPWSDPSIWAIIKKNVCKFHYKFPRDRSRCVRDIDCARIEVFSFFFIHWLLTYLRSVILDTNPNTIQCTQLVFGYV